MAAKSSGSLDGDAAKSTGSLDKDPSAETAGSDSAGYDYSDHSGGGEPTSGGAYEPPKSDGSSSSSHDDSADRDDPSGDDSPDSGENSTGNDAGDDDSGGDGDTPIDNLPGEVPPGEGPDEPGRRVAIDIDLMVRLIAAMERAREQIPELAHGLRTILSDLDLDVAEASGFDRVTAWIDDELPMLRRRLALAEAIEDGDLILGPHPHPSPTPLPTPLPAPLLPGPGEIHTLPGRREVTWDGELVATVPPHEAAESGRRAATLISQGDGAGATEAAELIRAHQADPYFAREFASNTDPSFIPDAAAESAGLDTLVHATVATASRATGELALDDSTRETWAATPA